MNAYSNLGKKKSIFISAFLFGLFHLNLQNLLGPIFLGIIFGIVVYKTNSIYSSILAHTINNSLAMTIGYFAMRAQSKITDTPAFEISFKTQMLVLLSILSIFAMVCSIILFRLIKKLPQGETLASPEIQYIDTNLLYFTPVIGVIILFIIINIKYLFL